MPVKRTTDPKVPTDPRLRYMLLVEQVMAELIPRFEQLQPPVTYHTYIGDFFGRPEGMAFWFAFKDRALKEQAETSGIASKIRGETIEALNRAGYPAAALGTLEFEFTSDQEIEEGGGRFYFFR